MLKDSKEAIRKEILTLLRNQKEEERLAKSKVIGAKLFELPEYKRARTILFYASFDGEVETFSMMAQAKKDQKTVCLPVIIKTKKQIIPTIVEDLENGLEIGPYGIKTPKENSQSLQKEDLDLVVVPGVAFDRCNYRLGRGEGYYDRFLSCLPSKVSIVGLAFDFQIVESLPIHNELDIPVTQYLSN